MTPESRTRARRHFDRRLQLSVDYLDLLAVPPRGWVKAIREALGMTAVQLGARMGVSQPRVFALEKAESSKSITLNSLERAADALECRLLYVLVPRQPLKEHVEARARQTARTQLASTRHSTALEAQSVETKENDEQMDRLVKKLIEKSPSQIWDDIR